jgi:hypothetical protein
MTRGRVVAAGAAAVVLFALSPAFQGYHVGRSIADTTCVTRFAIQFCKDEHARIEREHAAIEARSARQECKAVAREAEEGKRKLGAGNYYLRCLRPGVEHGLLRKWEAEERKESEQQLGQAAHQRTHLESEAASLKQRAKRLTEEQEQLDHESKFSLGSEKSSESANVTREAEKKLEEAQAAG